MKALLNIEKSAFRKGEYVGYCHGVWLIQKQLGRWRAYRAVHSSARVGEPYCICSETLENLSAQLFKESAREV